MLDFLMISTRTKKQGSVEIYPKFIIKKSSDLMIRGGDFYAIWIEERGMWSTDEQDALHLIDAELKAYSDKYKEENNIDESVIHVNVRYLWDSESGMIDAWHKYCQKQMRDNFNQLDEKLIFSNEETKKTDYASRKLNYPLETGKVEAWDKLISTLYSPEERHKIEWAIGSIVSGDSKKIQKFMVLYGGPGTGKSTILNIVQKLFEGYYSVFDAKALGSSSNSFALEAFKSNPLVAIQHDGDLSKIEDNTRLNSLVSHEMMTINEKFKATYASQFKCFLFMGTNKPVKITDGRSGILRRLIDVSPSGDKLGIKEYKTIIKRIDFELGSIATHCKNVYLSDPGRYDDYIPVTMLGASNDFYNYVLDSFSVFKKEDGVTLKSAWEMYKTFCEETRVPYPVSQRVFKEELRNYFRNYYERYTLLDGTRVRSYFCEFRTEKFRELMSLEELAQEREKNDKTVLMDISLTESIFDKQCAEYPAQYATRNETPTKPWDDVKTKLSELNTSRLHYVKVPENHIVIDFDIQGPDGKKDFEQNLKEASKWPPTYAELSKSGAGVHLHYIYSGDASKLSRVYDDHVEIKVFTGKSSLRRKLTKCNGLPISTISSGLPLKGDKKVVNNEIIQSEKGLRTLIKRNLQKEYNPGTKPSVEFIGTLLEKAYNQGMKYDVSDMRGDIIAFANNSTHHASYCLKLVNNMKWRSDEPSLPVDNDESPLVFYDIEVFPNLFLVNWKAEGEGKSVVRMINPSPAEIEELVKYRLVGFNCRRYDNHILYGRLMGYTVEQLYRLSQRIINGERGAMFGEAYNISYTDVYDFCSKKQSLKKWEIELGIHHHELGLKWDEPVPEEMWIKVAEYCDSDVLATEAVFNARKADFAARQILADIAGSSVNDTTNSLSTKIIFGKNRKPQDQFNYRDMGNMDQKLTQPNVGFKYDPEYTWFDVKNRPIFPGYKYEFGKSTYRGEEVGEGGYVYAEPGIYWNVALLDVASMHPSSIIAEELFGKIYTKRFEDIKNARVAIKHHNYKDARTMLDGALSKYVDVLESDDPWFTADDLASALKIVINSVYGLTAAKFDNAFRDIRNKDNIVAKRGALFMVNLKHEIQARGFTVAHIKTDSIKIPDATPEIIQFVMDYGKLYGYDFEHEATYERMCLVNDAVYIAKYKDGDWTATGAQFQVPYVFKTLFSKENIEFDDLCETKSVKSSIYLDTNEGCPDVSELEKEFAIRVHNRGLGSDDKQKKLNPAFKDLSDEELETKISEGHKYDFVGRVGRFCPIKPGFGGGFLMRDQNDKYYSVTGTKGYRWMESELVKDLGLEDAIDRSYYDNLINDAVDTISQYGDFGAFVD